jgi:hypothetical protein
MDYANVVRQLADAIIDLGLSDKLTVYDLTEGEVTPGRYLPQVQKLLGELAWCISHGANVKFYEDGTVNLYFYPSEDANDPIEELR